MTGPARQWEDWIAEQAAGIVRREMAPVETWESEGGSQRAEASPPYPFTRCRSCSSAIHIRDLIVSGLRTSERRLCCMACHQRNYPEDGRRPRVNLSAPLPS